MRHKSVLFSTALVLVLAQGAAPAARAASVESGSPYRLEAGQVVRGNLYAFGSTVVIAGLVTGDVVAAATSVEIAETGVVEGDLLAAGQSVTVRGTVGDDVRAAAFTVHLDKGATVGGDFVSAAFSVSAAEGSSVSGRMLAAGYQGLVDGRVDGDLTFYGAGLALAGSVGGSVSATVDAGDAGAGPPLSVLPMPMAPPRMIGPGLQIEPQATIGGDLTVTSPAAEVAAPPGVVAGSTLAHRVPAAAEKQPDPPVSGAARAMRWLLGLLRDAVALILVGAVVMLAAPRALSLATGLLAERSAASMGWGCLTAIVALAVAVAVPVLVVGAGLILTAVQLVPLVKLIVAGGFFVFAAATAGTYLLTWLGSVIVGNCTGHAVIQRLMPLAATRRWLPLLLGLTMVALLLNLPYLGTLFRVLVPAVGLGAVVLWLRTARPMATADPTPPPPTA